MEKYLIEKDTEITPQILGQYLQKFQTKELPILKRMWNYYIGKQKILFKQSKDESKVFNKIVTNYCKYIVDNYRGYLVGIPVSYENENMQDVIDILNYNDVESEDAELLRQALIFGKAFELNYVDAEGKQRFRVLDSRNCIDIYDNTLNNDLQYVVRFWEEELDANNEQIYTVEVYGKEKLSTYKSDSGFNTFTLLSETPLFYKDCPCTVLKLNEDCTSVFEQIIGLQDAYNEVVSGNIDDFDAFADAYMIIKGMTADTDDLAEMKSKRVLLLDADADASYLTKNINDVQVQNTLKKLNDNIHKIANCPDFTDEAFMAQSGVAIRYKLVGFENSAAGIAANFKKALQRRIELICSILALTDTEEVWRDVKITISRNLPFDLEGTVAIINQLRGLVSTRTLLSLLPFVKNVAEELKAVEEEKLTNMELYSFGNNNSEDEEVEEDGDEE